MIKMKSLKLMSTVLALSALLVACGPKVEKTSEQSPEQKSEQTENAMKYIEMESLKKSIESGSKEYVIIDARKVEDYNKSHIAGAYIADQDAANKGGDDAKGIENLKVALKESTGNEVGTPESKYALVCYSGKSYAQKATDLMLGMGISADQIYTLEGGMKAWESGGDEYKGLLE